MVKKPLLKFQIRELELIREINEIWERFYKADISRKSTKYGESGLGLAIVKSLVDSHHGRISVRSEIGQGTTFRVVFPGEPELS